MFTAFMGLPPKLSSLYASINQSLKGSQSNLPPFKAFQKNLKSENFSGKNMKLGYALALLKHSCGMLCLLIKALKDGDRSRLTLEFGFPFLSDGQMGEGSFTMLGKKLTR